MPTRRAFGCQSMVSKLKKVLVKPPVEDARGIKRWRAFHYDHPPNMRRSLQEWVDFVSILKNEVDEVVIASMKQKTALDSPFVQDPALVLDKGALICRMGKKVRRSETKAMAEELKWLDIPVKWWIKYPGTVEGGDCLWLDEENLAVGITYRTNIYGYNQLDEILKRVAFVHPVHLPHWEGPDWCFHLMNLISMVDRKLALAYVRMLPVSFLEKLKEMKIDIIEVDKTEFDGMSPNVLTIEPGKVIMLAGYPKTRGLLTRAGVDVITFKAPELCLNRAGGPSCLSRPLLRVR
jgi:dimethylargininase